MRLRLSTRRTVTIGVATVAIVAVSVAAVWALGGGPTTTKVTVTTATAKRGILTVTSSAAGTVQPINSRALTFATGGTLATVEVKAGDEVRDGDILATLDPTDAQDAVNAAQEALDAANTNLALAKEQASSSSTTNTGGGNQGDTGTDSLLRAEQTVNSDALALDQAEAALAGTTITAPAAGRVLSVAGAVGDTVQAGGSGFIVVGGLDALAVQASFSEADVAAIKVGQDAIVTLADHPGATYQATVTQIDPAGSASGSLIKYGVQLAFASVPTDLLLGQSANVAVTTRSVANVLYVPAAAVSTGRNGSSTVTVRASGGDAARAVTTGLNGDQGTEIMSGLTAGDVVVITAH